MPKLRFSYLFRVILPVILAGFIVSSCSRHTKVTMLQEIQLGATGVSTKALVTTQQSLIDLSVDNHTGFGVYGYKNISTTTRNYDYRQFNNVLVYPSGKTNTTWTYSPKRYWDSDPDAFYQFAAYWPYLPEDSISYVTEANKILTINDIPNWQKQGSGNDFLVATKRGHYRDASGNLTTAFPNNSVNFSFSHILANIVVKGYYIGKKNVHVNVHEMKLGGTNMLTTGGSADYTLPFAGQTDVTQGFSNITTGNGTHTLLASTSPAVTLPETSWYNDSVNNPNQYETWPICSWFVVPSTGWQGLTLNLTYSLGDITQSPAPVAIPAVPVTAITLNNGTTLPQYKYIITLKFNSASNGVEIESVQVADWNTVEVSTGVYNW